MAGMVLISVGLLCAVVGAREITRPAMPAVFMFGLMLAGVGSVVLLLGTNEVFV